LETEPSQGAGALHNEGGDEEWDVECGARCHGLAASEASWDARHRDTGRPV